jgi:hypothetical protein
MALALVVASAIFQTSTRRYRHQRPDLVRWSVTACHCS